MKFIDLEAQYQRIKPELDKSLAKLFVRQDFILGKDVDVLERRLAEYAGVKHCVTCSNGTDALSMALILKGYGPGDAVFVPDFTFFSTAEVVAQRGAVPVLVDCRADSFNMDPAALLRAVKRVEQEGKLVPRMVIPVDLFGLCADYDAIREIADAHHLAVLEDGAQGFGAEYHGRRACSLGDIAATSFFPAKPLGCYGDGGAVFTDDDETAARLRSLRVHGKGKTKYENNSLGLNARLDTIQAAVLNCKLDLFEEEIALRNRAAAWYHELLCSEVKKPEIPSGYQSVWAQYTIILPDYVNRSELQELLKASGVPTMVYYERPLHLQKALAYLGGKPGDFPVSEYLSSHVLSLPMHPYLKREEVETAARYVNRFVRSYQASEL
ncbi:MAG: DegT/DnrJ/EryC1/StrS family aminotransferase [Oscillospiraceae bacterium]|nr:DegT/DnrJ/EryC1/StrS family aminotransferase [Oscillospiraceae bacterium]MDY3064906.1 DegT/DnrJ/EryC1/StrS family aminotransferase [Oscillospiraceae bacterium]